MAANYSTSRSPGSSKFQLGGGSVSLASRLRSSSSKKPPEPLRRAVADCLSASAPTAHHGTSSASSESSRTLRDYLASHLTTDLAYGVVLDHTLAERERSPAVVAKSVALLKRYLLRYKPSEDTLLQIDRFCLSIIAECDMTANRKLAPLSRSLRQQNAASLASITVSPLPVSSFASAALVKSLHYVRSLVAQHIPKRSFQPAAFAGAPFASRQALPSLSSLLRRSFTSQLNPSNVKESPKNKEISTVSAYSPILEEVDTLEDRDFMPGDVFKWRWSREQQQSLSLPKSDQVLNPKDVCAHNFLEVGAAALLVGDMEAKMKGEPWRAFGSNEMPYLDQLLQPSLLPTVTNSASARAHLRAITALKRSKAGPNQIWEDSPVSTFRPRTKPLFQYRHYSEQQPLRLNPTEVCEVIAAVCSETPAPNAYFMTLSSKMNNSGKPSIDVAASVLVKLVIDMYVLDSKLAAPLTLSMLEEMINAPQPGSKDRAFDLILNLGIHAHLLEPPAADEASSIAEEYSEEAYFDCETQFSPDRKKPLGNNSAIDKFECWILGILYEVLLHLVQIEEKEESVWASALSCLLYFVCDKGRIRRSRLRSLDIRVVKALLQVSSRNSWAEVVHSKLIGMFTNMFYEIPEESDKSISATPVFLIQQVDLIGGIEFIFAELMLSNSREERRNLYLVLFDYVVHQINETCMMAGISEYSDNEVQPIATLLMLADAPEALHISIKLGVEGILELLQRSIFTPLSKCSGSDRLITFLAQIVEKLEVLIKSFTHLDKEFAQSRQITKSLKSLKSMDEVLLMKNGLDGVSGNSIHIKAKLSWATLHSLLHSKRAACRHNGHLWLGDLLIAEIAEGKDESIWSSIRKLQQKVEALADVNDYSPNLDIPLSIWLMFGMLKSKNNLIRMGFLFVLERLLMRCKFLLDESEVQHVIGGDTIENLHDKSRLEKANAVIDIMSSALSLMAQLNETDCMNILKMCEILLSQLCLKVLPSTSGVKETGWSKKGDAGDLHSQHLEEPFKEPNTKYGKSKDPQLCETASMSTLLLHGQAVAPMQLVGRVPTVLFYWPLIQLAGAATDNIALGVSVGSKGRGNVPGATSDIRATLLLLLIGKCTEDPAAFEDVGGEPFFRALLEDIDSRVAYYSSTFLLKKRMSEEPESYQRLLHNLVSRAQQSNNEKLLENPYLQMRGILQLSSD
ncbi:hypothetical protein DM860_003914 [Cuscuta australis]|uniref:Uncharacterized protein n=1 Tax=Cuscuta australis TaxID=267555 RepID=A0A328CUX3_9ASTE|nr:hypothetical protein DM860_003914 [Cuscuta australis]